jgi:hypothetical protein
MLANNRAHNRNKSGRSMSGEQTWQSAPFLFKVQSFRQHLPGMACDHQVFICLYDPD